MRFVPFVAICATLTLGVASPALAITNGSADLSDHPEVGALIADKPHPDGTWSYCTGTLISPTVFLTAAHCGERGQKTARVSFAGRYQPGAQVYTGRFIPDARYRDESELHDMAVVTFDTAIPNIKPATLPPAGMLDGLEADNSLKTTRFTPVGYGSLNPRKGAHGSRFHYTDTRNQASISFDTLTRRWLELSPNSKGDGGTCFGDSGGPNFLGGRTSHLLVATTITGNDDACKTTNVDYRLDTPSARRFLGKFVTLP
ncbi:S1 family peptidase [Streptosporangium sp. NBC_01756]|uniref:S1 family peptidase n=1 Tax=Streptosporangium sp. NBC_01756 TaxID=2975950 RepID=UPI002DDB03D0|nr:trypsin-like serine protease [Streptosporangium sp. NBC_01756]WSC86059.1 trypsin-like serine protease [Streptosporangium sp. NBC_01756]